MRELLFAGTPPRAAAVRAASRAAAAAFAAECRAVADLFADAEPEHREFVHGEVACLLHVAPATGLARLNTALALVAQPRLLASLERGQIGVGHALALLSEVEHLDAAHAAAVLAAVLDEPHADERTPGELRSTAKRAALRLDPATARTRHEAAKRSAGVRGRPLPDGMGRLTIDCTATEMATALAATRGRAAAMTFDDDVPAGQRDVAAVLHALGCDRTTVQAVIECPVERVVDVHALAHAPVWTVDVRIPAAVALGLSDHPAVLAGYGPIGADQARALLPAADLVRACVDHRTGEVLAVDPPVRRRTWTAGSSDAALTLRRRLVEMATSGSVAEDLRSDGYVPSEALGRLVDLRDVTSTFPGDATPARRTDRDHRLPWPLGPTDVGNLQNLARHWHRAKHSGWRTHLLADGSVEWRSPRGGRYVRRPKRNPPPPVPPGTTLPPLDDI